MRGFLAREVRSPPTQTPTQTQRSKNEYTPSSSRPHREAKRLTSDPRGGGRFLYRARVIGGPDDAEVRSKGFVHSRKGPSGSSIREHLRGHRRPIENFEQGWDARKISRRKDNVDGRDAKVEGVDTRRAETGRGVPRWTVRTVSQEPVAPNLVTIFHRKH